MKTTRSRGSENQIRGTGFIEEKLERIDKANKKNKRRPNIY